MANILKENKKYSTKLLEVMSENNNLKDKYEIVLSQNKAYKRRLAELEKRVTKTDEIKKNYEIAVKTFNDNESYLKRSISSVEKENYDLNE